ncbi:pyridoxamine 5'-phosphate oxidase [Pedobacter yulinensis]|uniref:Pyridoxamine 5'-phosphate oxidase n=1 Tax=Pedobacter yulinensis TaxID=2126353 RepID=A0A2T3HLN7_9SPHI|nr:pyridoxamine 5'-phosphate oxidase family protein [Pedobacter yulinensis]PST83355.1 pyridoxamine 5'-phosphate oxidase [Pedobacter yulinensis]
MLGELNKREIIDLLESQTIGRLGCHAGGETYIVPVSYVYSENAVYAHSGEGKKVTMMRESPKVCFQVDAIASSSSWKSVILWGTFEELSGEERQQAMQGIIRRIMPISDRPLGGPSHGIDPAKYDRLVVYKIHITEGTGRFESHGEPDETAVP